MKLTKMKNNILILLMKIKNLFIQFNNYKVNLLTISKKYKNKLFLLLI